MLSSPGIAPRVLSKLSFIIYSLFTFPAIKGGKKSKHPYEKQICRFTWDRADLRRIKNTDVLWAPLAINTNHTRSSGVTGSVRADLTSQHQPASRTGSPCGRSVSWRARSAWRRWACRRRCAGARTLGSGWRAPSRVAAAGTASAPWPPAERWRRRSRPPCGKPSGCGDSRATLPTKPWRTGEEREVRSFKFHQVLQ